MIISHKHKFIFIKVPKTAGTSVEINLSKQCGNRDVVTKETTRDVGELNTKTPQNYRGLFNPLPDLNPTRDIPKNLIRFLIGWKYYDHIPARLIKKRVGEQIWNSYFKFCFERNPWDKVVSTFNWRKRLPGREQKFGNFVERKMFSSDSHLYTIDGEIAVDYIGRFENLDADLKEIYDRLELDWTEELPKTKAHTRDSADDYRAYYNERQREIVAVEFQKEISLLGYTFDGEDGS